MPPCGSRTSRDRRACGYRGPARPGWIGSGVRTEENDVVLPLVGAFAVVVFDVVVDGALQGRLAKEDKPVEAFVLDGADEAFGESVFIRPPLGIEWEQHNRLELARPIPPK